MTTTNLTRAAVVLVHAAWADAFQLEQNHPTAPDERDTSRGRTDSIDLVIR